MKRLVLCCDGTWNRADQERNHSPCPTNVVQLALRTAKRDGATPQIIYYDQGVGTGNVIDRLSGGALGEGLEDNIHDAYRFLVANYEAGDEVFLFGFSRGAFTIRSLAGMVRKCGILKREVVHCYRQALDLYRSEHRPDTEQPVEFRRLHSIVPDLPVEIRFLGVWDTVGSLGIPLRGLRWLTRRKYQFHDTELSQSVRAAYHALAIDERRGPFQPTLWSPVFREGVYQAKEGQTIEQVWFCGAHSDVGGGYAERGLTDVSLEWMMSKAQAAGLVFDHPAQEAYPLHPDRMATMHDSKRGFYRLTIGVNRVIGSIARVSKGDAVPHATPDPTQSVHQSVRDRWDRDPRYRPRALREYFARIGDARAEDRAVSR